MFIVYDYGENGDGAWRSLRQSDTDGSVAGIDVSTRYL